MRNVDILGPFMTILYVLCFCVRIFHEFAALVKCHICQVAFFKKRGP